jgi:LmbE family N-acetylglucosaminyl deacetylase
MTTSRRVSFRSSLIGWMVVSTIAIRGEPHHAALPQLVTVGRVRALVVSPHPDDATLGAGGLIQRIIHRGGTVQVVQMTGGDGFPRGVLTMKPRILPTADAYRWYGSVREREAIRAMRQLGIHRPQVRLLGFPDGGLCSLASTNRTGPAFSSPYTRRESPPDAEQLVRGTMYRGDDLIRELARLIHEFRPTLVVLPGSADEHPDHCATHLLVHQALTSAVEAGLHAPRMLHYVIHYPRWLSEERVRAGRGSSADTGTSDWQWRTLTLKASEQAAKRRALDAFHSQMLVMPDFLKSFARDSELFVESEPELPIPCWCSGVNIVDGTRVVH